jgi:putative oxygen-independent coproporphyrinogen III oxidase
MTGMAEAPEIPLSLYLHFPWCVRKCPYCDFNSHALRGDVPEEAYVDALLRDLDFELAQRPESRPLISIFMGGGTPSLFSGKALARVLEQTARRLRFASDIEITLEANPGTVDEAHFRDYHAAGINRLSIGVQSLNATHLKKLGRIHNPDDARRAVEIARRSGFDNLNLDLMYALPDQTLAEAQADLSGLIALAPEHASYYQLTLEPNTEFAARPPTLPDDDLSWEMQVRGQALLAEAGYTQYEVSAYAKVDRQARHNLNYWTFGDYLGIGAGAHAKRTQGGTLMRLARHKHPRTYQEGAGSGKAVTEQRQIPAQELPFEYVMNALRLNHGFAIADYECRTGLLWEGCARTVSTAVRQGLLETAEGQVRASALGQRHLNSLLTLFLD